MRHYRQLAQEQRYGIYTLLKTGHDQSEIAEVIGIDKSTISSELKQNRRQRGYHPNQAHEKALQRRQGKSKPPIDAGTWAYIETLILSDWSPEQIHGWMEENLDYSIGHERIYLYRKGWR